MATPPESVEIYCYRGGPPFSPPLTLPDYTQESRPSS